MTTIQDLVPKTIFSRLFVSVVLTATLLTLLAGCSTANYGQYKRSTDVANMFESFALPDEYKYYYAGADKNPDALLGLRREYTLKNDLWKETAMEPKQLKNWINEFYLVGYSAFVFGQYILDPNGKVIGLYYSKYDGGPVRMESENEVVVHLPDTDRNRRPMFFIKNDISY